MAALADASRVDRCSPGWRTRFALITGAELVDSDFTFITLAILLEAIIDTLPQLIIISVKVTCLLIMVDIGYTIWLGHVNIGALRRHRDRGRRRPRSGVQRERLVVR